jgi:hypothetical protein
MYTHIPTIFNELLNFIPWNKFDTLVRQHKVDRYKKRFSAKNLLTILMYAQAAWKDSLRDIETSLNVLRNKHYHRWLWSIKRSTIAYNNNHYDSSLFETIYYELNKEISHFLGARKFNYFALDSTTISLSLSLFPWAKHRTKKWWLKMHMLLDNYSLIPQIITITDAKTADIKGAKKMWIENTLVAGDFLLEDRGYVDYDWYNTLNQKWIFFVTRAKTSMDYIVIQKKNIGINWVIKEEVVELFHPKTQEKYQEPLRMIHYISQDDGHEYVFLTNNFELNPKLIALLYKKRREIETFFKFLKGHLKILSFLWTSENAVKNQLRIAMIYYLILSYIKFKTNTRQSLHELSIALSVGLVLRIKIIDLLGLTWENIKEIAKRVRDWPATQLSLF